jgi:hypothetical protein
MSFTVAIPQTPLLKPLVERAEAVCAERGLRLRVGTEQQCAQWLATHAAELALLTPLGYAREAFKTDYRVIPATGLMLEGFTTAASLYLKPACEELRTCGSPHADDFLMLAGAAVFSEKFDVEFERIVQTPQTGAPQVGAPQVGDCDVMDVMDVMLDYGADMQQSIVLDLSDEWTDHTQMPLPVALWVCRPDGMPDDLAELVAAMTRPSLPREEHIVEQEQHGTSAEREGTVFWHWTDDSEAALQATIELLYYWQFVGEIAAIKLWEPEAAHPLAA